MGKNTIWYQTAKRGALSRLVDLDVERDVLTGLIAECDAALSNGHAPKGAGTLADAVNADVAAIKHARFRPGPQGHADIIRTPSGRRRGHPRKDVNLPDKFHGKHWTQQPENKAKLRRVLKQAALGMIDKRTGRRASTTGNPNRNSGLSQLVLNMVPTDGSIIQTSDAMVQVLETAGYPFLHKGRASRRGVVRATLDRLSRKGLLVRIEPGQYRRVEAVGAPQGVE
jgi:hypothetical protein